MTRFLYQLRNARARLRALLLGTRTLAADGAIAYEGELQGTLITKDGRQIRLGVLSRRVVTTAGVNFLRDDFNAGTQDITNLNYHDSGTGTAAEAVGDTALGTQAGPATRATGTQSAPATKQYRTVGTIAYVSTLAITEHGLFNQAAQGGTLWDRSVFSAINVVSGDSIQFTYTLSISDGG